MAITGGTKGLADNWPKGDVPVLNPLFATEALQAAGMNMHQLALSITSPA